MVVVGDVPVVADGGVAVEVDVDIVGQREEPISQFGRSVSVKDRRVSGGDHRLVTVREPPRDRAIVVLQVRIVRVLLLVRPVELLDFPRMPPSAFLEVDMVSQE